jgi:sterol desaturase/sphingolipid hydroxylase (fatty acid hydroxylase superfamily)
LGSAWGLQMTGWYGKLRQELETPREQRPFGSGWLSGSGALLCGLVGLMLVVAMRYPGALTTPELSAVLSHGYFRLFVHMVLGLGYIFALLSLVLRPSKLLGYTALGLVMATALLAGTQPGAHEAKGASLYFGLDFFVLNVLFTGFVLLPLERIWPHRKDQTVFRPEWNEDMFYYLVSSLFVQVLTYVTLAPSNFVSQHADLAQIKGWIASQPFLLQLVLIMLFSDFVQYWVHRAFHVVPFLWQFHAVHHSAKSMDWIAGARMHILEIFVLRSLTALPMLTLGFDPGAVQAYVLIVYFQSALVHANVGWNLTRIERFLVTPRHHHWHHGIEKEAIDVNFAIHFPLYDWLFGTYHMPEGRWPEGYGIAGHPVPQGYMAQLMHPFRWARARLEERKARSPLKPGE